MTKIKKKEIIPPKNPVIVEKTPPAALLTPDSKDSIALAPSSKSPC